MKPFLFLIPLLFLGCHVPNATGRWELVQGEARVVWSDGWRDILRAENGRIRKYAFKPGTTFSDKHDNTDSAEKR